MRQRRAIVCALFSIAAAGGCTNDYGHHPEAPRGDPERGLQVLHEYECGVCHLIPGVRGAVGRVGPPLSDYGASIYVAGKFPNTVEFLVPFIRDAPSLAPETAMPAFEMSESQAHDIAAYLYSLK